MPQPLRPSPPPQPQSHRLGPRPFGLHLMMGLSASLSLPFVSPSLKNALPSLNPANSAAQAKLAALLQSQNSPAFDAALMVESVNRAHAFLKGVQTYRHHPARRDVPEAPVIWSEGTTKLRDYNPFMAHAPVVLVIPSLINRYTILDLDIAPSFLHTLAAAGFRPLVVDWDEPGNVEENFALDDYVKRLVGIVDWLCDHHDSSRAKPSPDLQPPTSSLHLLGYCMGGLLALALATLKPERMATLTLMATPWDFHQPDAATGQLLAEITEPLAAASPMPVDMLQYLFALLQPFQALTKFVDFAALDPASMEARHFVLLEDWLNDGVPLPAKVAETCWRGWYGDNLTAQFAWCIGGQIIDPRALPMPSYVVVPGRDRIVPPESALPLGKLLPHASLHEPMTGHIGMMASRQASQQVWKPFLRWLGEHA